MNHLEFAAELVVLLPRPLGNQDRLREIGRIDDDQLRPQWDRCGGDEDENDQCTARHVASIRSALGLPSRDTRAIPGRS